MTESTDTTPDEYESTDYRRDLQVSAEGRTKIGQLQDVPNSPFSDADMKDIYVFAVAYGYNEGCKVAAEETGSTALVQRKTLSDEQVATMEAVAAASEGTPEVLEDQKQIATIAQQYMLGGVDALIDRCKAADSPRDELISEAVAAR